MKKLSFYGRRILMWQNERLETVYTLSGQWVGHSYGHEFGTKRQRDNAMPRKAGRWELQAISKKVLWNANGVCGDELTHKQMQEFNVHDFYMVYSVSGHVKSTT